MSSVSAPPADVQPQTATRRQGILQRVLAQRELGIFLVVLLLCIMLSLASKNFLSEGNLKTLVLGLSFDAIVAVGMTLLDRKSVV